VVQEAGRDLDSQVQTDAKAGDLIKFQIKAQFNDPTAPVAARQSRHRPWCGAGQVSDRSSGRSNGTVAQQASLVRADWRIRARVGGCRLRLLELLCFELNADIDLRQSRLTAMRADIAKGNTTARQLPQFQQQVAELQGRLENLRQVLPDEKDVADILRRIEGLAVKSNLKIQRFQPAKVVQQKLYAEIPYRLEAEGTYHNSARSSIRSASSLASSTSARFRSSPRRLPSRNRTIVAECTATTFVLQEGAMAAEGEGRCPNNRRSASDSGRASSESSANHDQHRSRHRCRVPAVRAGIARCRPAARRRAGGCSVAAREREGDERNACAGCACGAGGSALQYDPQGRRDPFVSLVARGSDPGSAASRPSGLPGLLISEVAVKGIVRDRSGLIAMVQGTGTKTFIVRAGRS
jgi:Tfp pilus assembly protein PilO